MNVSLQEALLRSRDRLRRHGGMLSLAAAVPAAVGASLLSYAERRAENGYVSVLEGVTLIALAALSIACGALSVTRAFERRAAPALAFAGSATVLIAGLASAVTARLDGAIDHARLALNQSSYERKIDTLAGPQSPRTVLFRWGSGGGFTIARTYTLVYDESGQIALPPGRRSLAWEEKVLPQDHMIVTHECPSRARHLRGHFYMVETLCQSGRT